MAIPLSMTYYCCLFLFFLLLLVVTTIKVIATTIARVPHIFLKVMSQLRGQRRISSVFPDFPEALLWAVRSSLFALFDRTRKCSYCCGYRGIPPKAQDSTKASCIHAYVLV